MKKLAILGLTAISVLVALFSIQAARLDYGWVLEGGLPKYMEAQKKFDWALEKTSEWASDTVVIGLHNPAPEGIFDLDLLKAVRDITSQAKILPGFGDIMSLSIYKKVKHRKGKGLVVSRLLPADLAAIDMAQFRQDVLTEPKLIGKGRLVSPDLKSTSIILELKTNMGNQDNYSQVEVVQWLKKLRAKHQPQGIDVYFFGAPYLRTHIDNELMGFVKKAIIAALIIIPLTSLLFFGFSIRLMLR